MDEQVRGLMRSLTSEFPRISTVPPGLVVRARRRMALTVTGGLVVVALAAIGASVGIGAFHRSQTSVPAHVTPAHVAQMVDHLPAQLAFTRDGQFVLTSVDGVSKRVTTGPLGDLDQVVEAWMPDGRSLLVAASGGGGRVAGLFRVGTDGTNHGPVPSSSGAPVNANSLSPDRTERAVPRSSGLFIESLDGTHPVQVISTASIAGGGGKIWYPAWSPDGTRIAFAWGGPKFGPVPEQEGLFSVNIDGSGLHRLASKGTWPVWSPDGTQLIVLQGGSMVVMNVDGTHARLLTSLRDHDPQPNWSPDGSMIAFDHAGDIYVIHSDGSGLAQVTRTPAREESGPLWEPQA